MIGSEFYQKIFDEFKTMVPWVMRDIADWYPSGQMEITIKLKDGSRMIYDYVDKKWQMISSYACDYWITEKEWRYEFARKLKRRLNIKGMNQTDLSKLTGITQAQLSRYLSGEASPRGYNVLKIARALECSVSELVDVMDLAK